MHALKATKYGLLAYNTNDLFVGKSINEYGEYSEGEVQLFAKLISPGNTVLDVGANIGTHAVVLSKIVGSGGLVMAFEPQRLAYYNLCANITLNNLANVVCLQQAVGKESGLINIPELDYGKANNFGGLSIEATYPEETAYCCVKLRTLDEMQFKRLDFIKIDVEGMEADVLLGATESIKKFKPILYVENDRQEKALTLIALIRRLGYEIYFHAPPLFNVNNFYGNSNNCFGNLTSINMLCVDPEKMIEADIDMQKLTVQFNLTKLSDDKMLLVTNATPETNQQMVDGMQTAVLEGLLSMSDTYAEALYDPDNSLKCLDLAYQLAPNWKVHNKYCATYARYLNYEAAYEHAVESLKLVQGGNDKLISMHNLAILLGNLKRYDESIKIYRDMIEIQPDHVEAHFGLAHDLLTTGQLIEGWKEYEWRFKRSSPALVQLMSCLPKKPTWDGSPLNGKRILIFIEQGAGDQIQLARYLPLVQAAGGHVILATFPKLKKLLENCEGVDEVVSYEDELYLPELEFDTMISLMSLPFVFNTTLETIPVWGNIHPAESNMPIITSDKLKVGIAWAGSETHASDFTRSCHLKEFKAIADLPNIELYGLHKGRNERIWPNGKVNLIEGAEDIKFVDLMNDVDDFNDTANVIDQLDLIITVDTSIAHLAGALGKPVWLLLHKHLDWRWLVDRKDSPWYPSMTIFRGKEWPAIFQDVRKALSV